MRIDAFNLILLSILILVSILNSFAMEGPAQKESAEEVGQKSRSLTETIEMKTIKSKGTVIADKKKTSRQNSLQWEKEASNGEAGKGGKHNGSSEEENSCTTAEVEIIELKNKERDLINQSGRIFNSENYRLFASEPRSIKNRSGEHTDQDSDENERQNLPDEEYGEYLRQKINESIEQDDFGKQLLTLREIQLFEKDKRKNRNKFVNIKELQKIVQKQFKNNQIKQCFVNSSIAIVAMAIVIAAGVIIKYT